MGCIGAILIGCIIAHVIIHSCGGLLPCWGIIIINLKSVPVLVSENKVFFVVFLDVHIFHFLIIDCGMGSDVNCFLVIIYPVRRLRNL